MPVFLIIVIPLLMLYISFYFFVGPFKKSEPEIIILKEPVYMVGVSKRTGMKTIFKDAARLGKEYKRIREQGLVENKKAPWAFVAISKNFQGIDSWEYLIGDVVDDLQSVPSGLKSFEIPAILYAVFKIQPKSSLAWGITIGRTKKYIYTEWLPNSKYECDNSILGDFEYHDKRSIGKKPEIDLYVAIKEKKV